ncbi:MAG TPA: hypothetical protein VFZ44_12740 [Pyrinomonadaceae bacterium]
MTREKASRLNLYACLAISFASYSYVLWGPPEINLGLMLAAPLAVVGVGFGARALSAPLRDVEGQKPKATRP